MPVCFMVAGMSGGFVAAGVTLAHGHPLMLALLVYSTVGSVAVLALSLVIRLRAVR